MSFFWKEKHFQAKNEMTKTPVLQCGLINEEINLDSTVVDESKDKNGKPVERDHDSIDEPFYGFSDEGQEEE